MKKSDIEKKWYIIDAEDKVLGRLASEIAKILRGKHKTIFFTDLFRIPAFRAPRSQ